MSNTSLPKVSCLMVTANRKALCRRAVRCYLNQTYPHKELVVLDNGTEDLTDVLADVPAEELVFLKVERTPETFIGGLRNISLEAATGEIIVPQWDDDDWYHPERIARQVMVLEDGYDMCSIAATLMHLDTKPYINAPYIGILKGGVPPTMMHRRNDDIRYPDLRRTSDSYYLNAWREHKHALMPIEEAYLYIRCFHGENLWGADHFLRRMRNTVPDLLAYGWHRYVRGDVFGHPRFQLDENAREAFLMYQQDSVDLGIFDAEIMG